jgi:prefoldin subunit 5
VNIGSNTAVYKTVNEAKKLVVQQSAEIKEVLDKITVEIQKLSERSQMIQKEVQGLVS